MKNSNKPEFSEEDFEMLLNPEATKLSFSSSIKVEWKLFKVNFRLKVAELKGTFAQVFQKFNCFFVK